MKSTCTHSWVHPVSLSMGLQRLCDGTGLRMSCFPISGEMTGPFLIPCPLLGPPGPELMVEGGPQCQEWVPSAQVHLSPDFTQSTLTSTCVLCAQQTHVFRHMHITYAIHTGFLSSTGPRAWFYMLTHSHTGVTHVYRHLSAYEEQCHMLTQLYVHP